MKAVELATSTVIPSLARRVIQRHSCSNLEDPGKGVQACRGQRVSRYYIFPKFRIIKPARSAQAFPFLCYGRHENCKLQME